MGKQLLFCVETDKSTRTDVIYIRETIKHFFGAIPDTVKVDFICMGGKNKYKNRDIVREIKDKTRMYARIGKTEVIYCVDTDKYESNAVQKKELEEIFRYCDDNNYRLVWFCHDIEEVYLGKMIENSDKKKASIEFQKNKKIENVDKKNLMYKAMGKAKSNILGVLEELIREN